MYKRLDSPQNIERKSRDKRIQRLYKTNQYSYRRLGKLFNVSPARIGQILKKGG